MLRRSVLVVGLVCIAAGCQQWNRLDRLVVNEDVEAIVDYFERAGTDSESQSKAQRSLWLALLENKKVSFNALLEQNVDPDCCSRHNQTLLCAACLREDEFWAKTLLNHGADPNFHGTLGDTTIPLLVASSSGRLRSVELLIDHGADIDFMTEQNQTALSVASAHQNYHVVNFLLEKGADFSIPTLERSEFLQGVKSHLTVMEFGIVVNGESNLRELQKTIDFLKSKNLKIEKIEISSE